MLRLSCLLLLLPFSLNAADKPDVLFIAVDDLNDWVGCLKGHPQVKTPNIDRLAARGMLFANAHCQAPLCNPSRTSLLTGLRPSSTGICGLAPWFRTVPALADRVTLPEAFKKAGYTTLSAGKVYHGGFPPAPEGKKREWDDWARLKPMAKPATKFVKTPDNIPAMDWGPFPEKDEETTDYQVASWAIDQLAKPAGKPLFLAVGFQLPHVPCYAPQKWFDMYPLESIQLPPVRDDDRDDTPQFSWNLHWKLPEPRLSFLRKANEWKPLVRAYLATTSLMDAQVGRVLDALEKSGRKDNTIVVLWSDHGWHLGEKGITGKNTLWERSTRVPLVFAGPGVATGVCNRPAELLDLYPTLAEKCGLDAPKDLEGLSLVPQLKDPLAPRDRPAITTHNKGNHGVRSEGWRYIVYADGSEELYDMKADPNEWTNLAKDPKHAAVKEGLRKWLPKVDLPPAPGSAARVLTYDPKTGEAVWEGKKIVAGEAEK